MAFQRRDGVFHCVIDDVLVLLDVAADRYLMPTGRLAAAYREVMDGSTTSEGNREALARLVGQGLLVPSTTGGPDILPSTPSARSALVVPTGRGGLGGRAAAVRSLLRVGWRRRTRGIAHLGAGRPSNLSGHPPRSDIVDLVAAFDAVARPLPREGRCLWRSFALADLLRGQGHDCVVVIGVKVRPFAAHCWVEWNGLLLNEAPETVVAFTPIYRS